jgi:4-hydroxy-3-methylbut-2-enyl diphosphate reductase
VHHLAELVDLILVVGSKNSSNSNRLREIGAELGRPSYLIDDAAHLDASWFTGVRTVGLTAGASAPEVLVQGVLDGLRAFGNISIETLAGTPENVKFKLPAEVADVEG